MIRHLLLITILPLAFAFPSISPACALDVVSHREPNWSRYIDDLQQAQAKSAVQDWPAAATLWARVVDANPTSGGYWFQLATARYQAKDYKNAIQAYAKAEELRASRPYVPAYDIACCYALMGEKDQAFTWLERAFQKGFRPLADAQTDTDLTSLHDDARFKQLVALDDVSKMTREQGWRYDLDLLWREIQRMHYSPFRKTPKEEFEADIRQLRDDIPKLNDYQVTVRFMQIVHKLGDGHSRAVPGHVSHRGNLPPIAVPVQFYLFTEGLFITDTDAKHADLAGAQVLRVGSHSVDEVMAALARITPQDNDMTLKLMDPFLLRFPQLLYGLDLIPDPNTLPLTLRAADGAERTVTLEANTGTPDDTWVPANKGAAAPPPLTWKNRKTPYWFEYLPQDKLLFVQYNQVGDDPKEPLAKFWERVFTFVDNNDVQKMVLDMRWNGGGNNFLNKPLIHSLIRSDKINQKGRLFVVVGRGTFSAAMCGATQIDRETNAIFVGEPTGSSPNFVGEDNHITLPYSKMDVSISDLYWQNSVAMDYRTWIAPALYTPPSFEAYRSNRDPAMEAILAYHANP